MFESGSVNNLNSKNGHVVKQGASGCISNTKMQFSAGNCWILQRRNLLKGTVPTRIVDEQRAGQMSKMSFLVVMKRQWGLQGGGGASISPVKTHSGVVIVCVVER